MNNNTRRQKGFTIVEVTLVMAFVSVLILAVIFVTVYTGKMYAKGVTLKSLNQVGRDVSDMIRRDMTAANPTRVKYIQTGVAPLQVGRLCMGNVSYVWNTTALLNAGPSAPKMKRADGKDAHLVRVVDTSSKYCTAAGAGGYPMAITATESATEYLLGTDTELAVYSFGLTPIYNQTANPTALQGMFNVRMTIGTYEVETTAVSGGDVTCKAPSDNTANFDYCSVRDFDLIIRAGGGS